MYTVTNACERGDLAQAMRKPYQKVFDVCPDWVEFSNDTRQTGGEEQYNLAKRLHELGILDECKICLWRGGGFRGYRIFHKQASTDSA